ncbi:zinc-binding dehydrogenase [Parahaliea mediterranea]|uniref:Zn-dependent alcohol dehydrogenase n=1 Tax=Parahaliea mediterranea TaxID=651086 RepID=A0A939IK38_9GAMM|nr:Zn-dependent alcohol dehydrogenase [Parahaliea mediterranea]MBN7796936.1 Zn-dependent alcohol dehydrogenase [Parahaliea mediterranea]
MKALVCRGINEVSVEEVDIDPPKSGELKIRMVAAGLCHSDLSIINGKFPVSLPIVLGHEGAGIVEAVGDGVGGFEPGDHVVLSFVPACGACRECDSQRPHLCVSGLQMGKMLDGTSRVHAGEEDLDVMQYLGCMAEYAVIPAACAVKIDKSIPLEKAALVGCGVMTGVGAAINTASVIPGSTVAVFGCGGVGISVIQGASIAGAEKIIAVDVSDDKLELAKRFGATHGINGVREDAVASIRELTDGGVDYAFEAVGNAKLMETANESTRRGGTAIIVGVGSLSDSISLNALMLSTSAKTLKGCFYGDANPKADFPRLLNLYRAGKLNLDEMVNKTIALEEAPAAFMEMESGKSMARSVIVF